MADKVDGQCSLCGERRLVMEGYLDFTIRCLACKAAWSGAPLGDLVEAAVKPAQMPLVGEE